jgi:hypothetical protein
MAAAVSRGPQPIPSSRRSSWARSGKSTERRMQVGEGHREEAVEFSATATRRRYFAAGYRVGRLVACGDVDVRACRSYNRRLAFGGRGFRAQAHRVFHERRWRGGPVTGALGRRMTRPDAAPKRR